MQQIGTTTNMNKFMHLLKSMNNVTYNIPKWNVTHFLLLHGGRQNYNPS